MDKASGYEPEFGFECHRGHILAQSVNIKCFEQLFLYAIIID